MRVKTILASTVAKLDSNVYNGGGTDDTAAIQAVLDLAKDGETGVHLIMDGAALVSHLELYSNTTIECMNKDCGFYQIAHTDDSILTNAIWNGLEICTRNVTLVGGTYNQNCLNQAHDNPHRAWQPGSDGVFNLCLEFYGIENLLVRDITILEFRTFAFTVGSFNHVTLENVWVDMVHHMQGNQDGFHFWGPGRFLTVKNCGGRVSDDIMNIGPDELDKVSSITDVLVDGIFLEDAEQAIRLLSREKGRLDRVTIRNVSGEYRSYGFFINSWFMDCEDRVGNFGHILIENVDLKEHPHTYDYHKPMLFSVGGNIENLTLKNIRHHNGYDTRDLFEFGLPTMEELCFYRLKEDGVGHTQKMKNIIIDGLMIMEGKEDKPGRNYITIYDKIENLVLRNVLIEKEQEEENGTLLHFELLGEVDHLIAESVYTEGLAQLTDAPEKIKHKRTPVVF